MTIAVELLASMGTDKTVYYAARTSLNAGDWTDTSNEELPLKAKRLIRMLAREGHWTPFGHPHVTLGFQTPIWLARQLTRSRIGLVSTTDEDAAIMDEYNVQSELSRRYVNSRPQYTIPTFLHHAPEEKRMGRGSIMSSGNTGECYDKIGEFMDEALYLYHTLIHQYNMAPEEARMILPMATDTRWVWTGSLIAWARICKQRLAPDAQGMTRGVAMKIYRIMEQLFPISWLALVGNAVDMPDDT